jgi:hypothetical protein
MLVAPDDGQLTGRNICRAWFFKTINVLIGSACIGIVFISVKNILNYILYLSFICHVIVKFITINKTFFTIV